MFAVQGDDAGVGAEPTETVDGSRKYARVGFGGATGWRLGAPGADVSGAIARTIDRLAVAYVVDGVGAAGARVGDGRRVREGARAVRQADRHVPGGAAPVRRHAAHRRARARRGLLRELGVRRRRSGRSPPRRDARRPRSRARRSRRWAAPRSRSSAASASRGSTTSTSSTSGCSRSPSRSAPPTTTSPSSPPSPSTDHRPSARRPRAVARSRSRRRPSAASFCHQSRFGRAWRDALGLKGESLGAPRTRRALPCSPLPLPHAHVLPRAVPRTATREARVKYGPALSRLSPFCRAQLGLFTAGPRPDSVDVSNDALWRLRNALLIERISPRVFRLRQRGRDVAPVGARGVPRRRSDAASPPIGPRAALHGFDGFQPGGVVEVLVPMKVRMRRRHVIVHHTRDLPDEDRTQVGVIPATSIARDAHRPRRRRAPRTRSRRLTTVPNGSRPAHGPPSSAVTRVSERPVATASGR